jgi:ATP-dependent Clp protease adapter protein ClpS
MSEPKKTYKKINNNFKDYNVVIWNDPMHSLEYVTKVLTSCIPNISEDEAIKHAYLIHTQQKAVVFSGLKEHSEHFIEMMDRYEPENKDGKLLPPLAAELRKNTRN